LSSAPFFLYGGTIILKTIPFKAINVGRMHQTAAITFVSSAPYTNNGAGYQPAQLPAFYHSYILLFACKPKNPV
jgi:hypothetical protein